MRTAAVRMSSMANLLARGCAEGRRPAGNLPGRTMGPRPPVARVNLFSGRIRRIGGPDPCRVTRSGLSPGTISGTADRPQAPMTEPDSQPEGDHAKDDVTPDEAGEVATPTRPRRPGPSSFNPRLAATYAVGALVIVLVVALVLTTFGGSSTTADDNPTVDAKTMQLGASGGTFTATTLPDAGMVTLDGKVTDLPTVVAGKPTVINLFSYSCTACRTEMPALEALHRQGGGRFQMVGVDLGDPAATTASFVKQTGVTYRIVRDPTSLLVTRLDVTAQPMTLWVDAHGAIVGHRYGAMTPSEMRSALREHLRISLPSA